MAPRRPRSARPVEQVRYLGCICVSVVLRRRVTGAYLTYVTDDTPYTAVVEMTNLVDPTTWPGRRPPGLPAALLRTRRPGLRRRPRRHRRTTSRICSPLPATCRDDVLATGVARARHVMPVPVPGRGDQAPRR